MQAKAKERVTERLLDLLVPAPKNSPGNPSRRRRSRRNGSAPATSSRPSSRPARLEDRVVELTIEQKAVPVQIFSNMGMENMDVDFQDMFDNIMPKSGQPRQLPIKEARKVLMEQETEALIDRAAVAEQAVERVENQGIVFLDEIDKVCGPAVGARPGRLAPGRAARPPAGRRRNHRQHQARAGEDRPHPLHRRRGVPHLEARRPDARTAGPLSRSASNSPT